MQRRVVTLKLTDVLEVRTASIIKAMMEAVRTRDFRKRKCVDLIYYLKYVFLGPGSSIYLFEDMLM
jgi:hypothetical protein